MDKLETFFKYVVISLMGFIILTVILQILAREIIYIPVSWTQEAAKYSFIWMSLIGAGLGIRNMTHVSIDLVTSKLPEKLQKISGYFVNLVVIVIMLILLIQSIKFSILAVGQDSPTLGIPMWYIYVSVILLSFLGILFSMERIVRLKKSIIKT